MHAFWVTLGLTYLGYLVGFLSGRWSHDDDDQ